MQKFCMRTSHDSRYTNREIFREIDLPPRSKHCYLVKLLHLTLGFRIYPSIPIRESNPGLEGDRSQKFYECTRPMIF